MRIFSLNSFSAEAKTGGEGRGEGDFDRSIAGQQVFWESLLHL